MVEFTGWARDLTVEVAGRGVVNHAGSAALRMIIDGIGLTGELSRVLSVRGRQVVHDRGRVLADTAVMIADGGRVLADLASLRDQAELYGGVASTSTLWRTLAEIGPLQRERIAAVRAKVRARVWKLIAARHGGIPPSRVADRDLGRQVVIRLDATLVIAHSDKQGAAGTFKGTYGHHSLTGWCDNTSESLAVELRPGNAGSNTAIDHIEVVDAVGSDPLAAPPQRSGHRRWGRRLPRPHRPPACHRHPPRAAAGILGRMGAGRTGENRDQSGARRRLAGRAGPPRRRPRPRRRRRGRADRVVAPLGCDGDRLATWPTGDADHLPPRTPSSGAQLSLMEEADGWRYQLFATNSPDRRYPVPRGPAPTPRPGGGPHPLRQEHRHRPFALGLVRAQPGLVRGRDASRATCCAGCGCCAWTGRWPRAEPKTLRYRLLHTAARLVRGQRKRKIKIPETWPYARQLANCLQFGLALCGYG